MLCMRVGYLCTGTEGVSSVFTFLYGIYTSMEYVWGSKNNNSRRLCYIDGLLEYKHKKKM